ncbi:hypothetical protein FRC04_006587 [Tulasnella sp. 424]|nr:hypothetical protein FRC04_006587 [Tulasnella sp. 424]KAG8960891.1 hypothetical protein FRC05_006534 [Tulasnella sp. 425]
MTNKPSPPAQPPPEIVDQALALLLTAMEQGRQPGDEKLEYMESEMTHLDRLAWRHQVAGEALQMAAQKRATLFRRQRNALTPINRLPPELLSAILITFVNDYPYQLGRIKALQKLAQVAWHWWQTIKSDPQFWTHIAPPMEGVEMQIRKAGILPLRLSWTGDVDGTDGTDDTDDDDCTDWDAVGDLVQRHASRWTAIELEDYDGEEAVLQALCTSHFPYLQYLRVNASKSSTPIGENWRLNLAQCQNLQEVHLPIMPYLPATPSSNPPIHRRTLHLNLRSMESCSSDDLESLLRLTPQLVELKVKNLLHDTNPPAPFGAPIIDLPNLRAVTGEEQDWIPLLAQIRAPRLEDLGLRYGSQCVVSGQTIFTVLVTWPSASTNQPEDAPLHSLLRNAGPSAAWRVDCYARGLTVGAAGSRSGRLNITLETQHTSRDQLPADILTPIARFGLPVDLEVSFWDSETAELEFWDEVLDATPSLRTFTLVSPVEIARQVMNRLSTKVPYSSSTSPRAPHLKKLKFELKDCSAAIWARSKYDVEDAVQTMLDKRREIFIQGGVIDPPKLVVIGAKGLDL